MAQGDVSKAVGKRREVAKALLTSMQAHEARLLAALGEKLGADASEAGEGAGFGAVLGSMRRAEERALERLISSDVAHEVELADDHEPLRVRDQAHERARRALSDARDLVATVYGGELAVSLRLAGALPRSSEALLQKLEQAVAQLKTATAPPSAKSFALVELGQIALSLDEVRASLEAAVLTVKGEEAQARATLTAKQEALADFDDTHRAVTHLFNALAYAADLDDVGGVRIGLE
jgi:hypothetical protein